VSTTETSEPDVRLRLDIAYDGSDFHGWAKQPGLRTVQHTIETALHQLVRGDRAPQLTVGGRTDAGVHARGQVAHVDLSEAELRHWLRQEFQADALNGALMTRRLNGVIQRDAEDVFITKIAAVPEAFDARFSAIWRRYSYRIADGAAQRDPLARRHTVVVDATLDDALLAEASRELLGLRDFSSFCKAREGSTAIRTLQRFDWVRGCDGVLTATVQADAFCHSMVRAIVGAVTAVASGRLSLEQFTAVRDAQERTSHFAVMPPHGLCLEEIGYPEAADFGARAEQTRARRS